MPIDASRMRETQSLNGFILRNPRTGKLVRAKNSRMPLKEIEALLAGAATHQNSNAGCQARTASASDSGFSDLVTSGAKAPELAARRAIRSA